MLPMNLVRVNRKSSCDSKHLFPVMKDIALNSEMFLSEITKSMITGLCEGSVLEGHIKGLKIV